LTGLSNFADSMYAIDELVFRQKKLSLEELLVCLRNNWAAAYDPDHPERWRPAPGLGTPPVEPERMRQLRRLALRLPKFGTGQSEVDAIAKALVEKFQAALDAVRRHP